MSGLKHYIGSKISITLHNDSLRYEGIIHTIDEKARKIVLKRVVDGDGTKYASHQVFYADDIVNLVVLGKSPKRGSTESSDKDSSEDKSEDSVKQVPRVPWNQLIEEEEDPEPKKDLSDDGFRLLDRPYQDPYTYLIGDYVEEQKSVYSSGLMPSAQFIDAFGKKFKAAVTSISNQRVVGLSVEGSHLSRFGTLSLLVFGCVERVYVFDVYKLGEDCFAEESLKSILESPTILKVIHDCRCLSDYLLHKHNVRLNNVFDTQVADVIVYKQTRGELPSILSGLLSSLNEHLHIVPDDSRYRNLWLNHTHRTNASWTDRPLKEEVIVAAAEQVVYLRELRNVLIEKMLMEFLHGVDLYLGHLRDAPDKAVKNNINRHLPRGFQRLCKLEESRQERYKRGDEVKYSKSMSRKTNHSENIENEKLHQRAGHWTGKDDFSDHYHDIHGRIVEMIEDYDDNSHHSQDNLSDGGSVRTKRNFVQDQDTNRTESGDNGSTEDNEDLETIDMTNHIDIGIRSASPFSNSSADLTYSQTKTNKANKDIEPKLLPRKFQGLRLKELDLVRDEESRSPSESGSGSDFADSDAESRSRGKHNRRGRRPNSSGKRGNTAPRTSRGGTRSSHTRPQSYSPQLNEGIPNDHGYSNSRVTPDFVKEGLHANTEGVGPYPDDLYSSPQNFNSGLQLSPNSIFKASDFPTLEEVTKPTAKKHTPDKTPVHSRTFNNSDPKIGIASIPSAARPPRTGIGRAKLRDHYIQNPVGIPGDEKRSEIARDLSSVPFPTDRELLRTPLVAEAAGPVPGKIVNVKRIATD